MLLQCFLGFLNSILALIKEIDSVINLSEQGLGKSTVSTGDINGSEFGVIFNGVDEILEELDAMRMTDLHLLLFFEVSINPYNFLGVSECPGPYLMQKLKDIWQEIRILDQRL